MTIAKMHQPCPDCGSKDALQVNPGGSTYCHSANHVGNPFTPAPIGSKQPDREDKDTLTFKFPSIQSQGIPERSIAPKTAEKFGVITFNNKWYLPYYAQGVLTGAKVREVTAKEFFISGDIKEAGLFGMQAFPAGATKSIVITEGEFDAMAAYQMLQGRKVSAVSIKNGAQSAVKDVKACYDYLNSYSDIVVNFDSDEAGQKAAKQVCALFPGKARSFYLPGVKDANEFLLNYSQGDYFGYFNGAQVYRPDDIIRSDHLYDRVMAPLSRPICRYPWDGLNLITYGIRPGELVTIAAGTGVGKSTWMKSVISHAMKTTKLNIGVFSLEEQVEVAALEIMSMWANKRLHLPTKSEMAKYYLNNPDNVAKKPNLADTITQAEKDEAYKHTMADGRLVFFDSGGNLTVEAVMDRLNYMAVVDNCPIIILDHISILVGMQQVAIHGNEREAIDLTMHKLRSLAESTGVTILLVTHLSRSGENHEEGGRVRLGNLRGSAAIAQLSNIAIAIERDSQAEEEAIRNTSTARVLKNRFSGETGVACELQWNNSTGKLIEITMDETAL